MRQPLVIYAPISGKLLTMGEVPDPVFSQGYVGPGFALSPDTSRQRVILPASGTVSALFPHAFAVDCDGTRSVLVHLGIDTVTLDGKGFDLSLGAGQAVRAGAEIGYWDPRLAQEAGLSLLSPVVAVQADPGDLEITATFGREIIAGQQLAIWH